MSCHPTGLQMIIPRIALRSCVNPNLFLWLILALLLETAAFAQGLEKIQTENFLFVRNEETLDLLLNENPVLRFVYASRDGSDDGSHYRTYKPFHQVFAPDASDLILTSGVPDQQEPHLYPHHRGMFFGFNRISYDGKKADTWHATNQVFTTCEDLQIGEISDAAASHTAKIGWYGSDQNKFAEETRTVVVYKVPAGIQLDWMTELRSLGSSIRLDGDPQHAGFHFRANQEVALENEKQTYFLRPDGKGDPGVVRNWEPQAKDPRTINLPWSAMSFVVQDRRYTVLRMCSPENPGETRGSERAYGRFGDYFEFDLEPDQPLKLKYRLWIQPGEMTVEEAEKRYREFVQAAD